MLGIGTDAPSAPEPTKTRHSKEAVDECIVAVNATLFIPHPTADDQPKRVACKSAAALHMVMPANLVEDKRHELDYCNTCMLVAEADGVIFIDNPASCGCLATQFREYLDCKSCYTKKRQKIGPEQCATRGVGQHLLGTTKEWMILKYNACRKCSICLRCDVEGCDKFPDSGCDGHCLAHATPEQKNAFYDGRKRCAVEGCDKFPKTGCNAHCLGHATQEQRNTCNIKKKD